MLEQEIGMQTTVIIGNSATFVFADNMVTPRGYSAKYGLTGEKKKQGEPESRTGPE
jgi:precorrin-3B C17-methyltransferase